MSEPITEPSTEPLSERKSESVDSESASNPPSGPTGSPRANAKGSIAAIVFIVLVALYGLIGVFVVPSVVESLLVSNVVEQTGVTPTIESVSFDPIGLRLVLRGFALPDLEGPEPIVSFEELAVDVRLLGFLSADVALEEVLLVAPRVSARRDASGELNLFALLANRPVEEPVAEETKEGEQGLPIVDIDVVRIERGELAFLDRLQTPAFAVHVKPIALEIEGLTTRAGGASPYSLVLAVGDATKLRWSGTIGLDPVLSAGEVSLSGFDLRVPWDFASDQLRFEITRGNLALGARYVMDLSSGLALSLTQAMVELEDVEILDRADAKPVLTLSSLDVTGIEVAVDATGLRTLSIADVAIGAGKLATRLEKDGSVHLVELLTPVATDSKPAEQAEASDADAPPADIRVDRVGFKNFEVDLEDRGPVRPVPIRLASLDLEILGYRSAPGAELSVTASAGLGESGRLALTGPIALEPLATRLAIEAKQIALGDFQPYLERFARLNVPKGALSAKLEIDVRHQEGASPQVTARGRIQIDDLLTIDQRLSKKFLEWKRLRIEGFDLSPEEITIAEVGLTDAFARFDLDAKGRSNLEAIFTQTEETAGAGTKAEASGGQTGTASNAAASDPVRIRVAKISVDGVGAEVDDQSVEPTFSISLNDLRGTVEGLSSETTARAKVALAGRVDDVAPIRIEGQINPLAGDAFTDIQIHVDGVSLPSFSAYSGRFVGYTIDRGKLGLDLHYKLNNRHLEAENLISLEQFNFGNRVESDTATQLPVALAVAVMRDRAGNISIPLPIAGDLDDPSFSLVRLLGNTLFNVITRVATAPFAAVAGLVGVSGEELSRVAFESGSIALIPKEEAELGKVATLLADRPRLRLEIRGRADPAVDGPGLRIARVDEAVRIAAFESFSRRRREEVGDPAAVVLDSAGRLVQLERLYSERIGGRLQDRIPAQARSGSKSDRIQALTDAALAALAAQVEIGDADWRALARDRAASVQRVLLATKLIGADRLFLADVEVGSVGGAGIVSTELSLRAE